ncbi:MAG: sulfite exporter TauE/SafE family protein [bacterium]
MTNETIILASTAASIAFFHTLLGPDHYLPFVMLARARKWSMPKTLLVTFFCGAGHVLSSILLGLIGIVLAVAVIKLETIEAMRGDFAAWMLIIFGFSYFVWGLHQLMRGKVHTHAHGHIGGGHHHGSIKKETTSWTLFIIFALGPCEPLIPLLMYPAARNSVFDLVLVTIVFGAVTILTMLGVVAVSTWGISRIRVGVFEKYAHALSGLAIFLCGIAVKFLGL